MNHIDKKCLGGAAAPCLVSGNCPLCCACKLHGTKKKGQRGRVVVKEPPRCVACGEPMNFPMGHALVCEKAEGAFIPEGRP